MESLERRLQKVEQKVNILFEGMRDIIVKQCCAEDEGAEQLEEMNRILQARNDDIYNTFRNFARKIYDLTTSSTDETTEDETTEETTDSNETTTDSLSKTDESGTIELSQPPTQDPATVQVIIPKEALKEVEEEEDTEEEDEAEEDIQEIDMIVEPNTPAPIMSKCRMTPFKPFRKALETFHKGTYFKIWRKWRAILDTLEHRILKETNMKLSSEIKNNVILPLTKCVINYKLFVANAIMAGLEYLKLFQELYENTPSVRTEINKVQILFTEFESILRNINPPQNTKKN